MGNPIKTLVNRYASLPYFLRMEVARRLLAWREESPSSSTPDRKNFVEQFWDEVEKSHNDGLYQVNPFSGDGLRFRC